jgi:hypothetical protein
MDEPFLDDYEKELVRFCAERYLAHNELIEHSDFPRYAEVGKQKALSARQRITEAGLIKGSDSESIEALPACAKLVRQWDNPPPEPLPDYKDKLSKWFWSKPWSIGVYVVVVGLPAVLGYVVMAKTILEWLGIIKGSK